MNKLEIVNKQNLQDKIHTIRGLQVVLDSDLAELYQVETKNLNRAVNRNIERFPQSFRFQLTEEEYENLRFQFDTSSSKDSLRFQFGTLEKEKSLRSQNATLENARGKHRKYLPYVFTEQGVSMLSAVLRSDIAIKVSIQIIEAFVNMRKFISNNALVFQRLDSLEQKQFRTDEKIDVVLNALEDKTKKPDKGIFFDGQTYDAYAFINDLLKSAKSEVVLIDNYIDDTVFTLFSKYPNLKIKIYTQTISKQLRLDFQKYSSQYKNIELKEFKNAHDRFLIIDQKEIYHIGASLKDLGKKWFAFSKFEIQALEILGRLK
ncbi:ORF6N domain-containing protein [Sulfurimonas crateris]|uniref:ORF6N domain-containing protein n=1 Tax=Sulfurimonas crateris TaxID=2574727 RepID=A0A4U2Z6V7_9BACT|nr:ORF6N domain-containing protein [Sulfurimonas crateris]TKI69967.1 ORF6N domain-containing protein [Sulfurimonas crateris]